MLQQFDDIVSPPDSGLRARLRDAGLRLSGTERIRDHMCTAMAPHSIAMTGMPARTGGGERVDFWHGSIDLGGVAVHYVDYQCDAEAVNVRVDAPQDGIMLKFPVSRQTRVFVDGADYLVRPNEFTIIGPGARYGTSMAGDSQHLAVAIDNAWLTTYLTSQDLPLRSQNLSFAPVAYRVDAEGYVLSNVLLMLVRGLCEGNQSLNTFGLETHLKQLITSAVLGLSPEYRQVGRAQSQPDAVPAYVLSAERFMQDSLQEQIGMDDIVRQSGVPRRTLFAGFRKHRGTTPMARLKAMRLKAVKAALETDVAPGLTVTEVAMDYGFYHLGRFSKDFRDAFGALPSEIRRRRI